MDAGGVWKLVAMGAVVIGVGLVGGVGQAGEVTAGGGGCHGSAVREGTGLRVALERNCFSPMVLKVEPGETVVFENTDEAKHDVAGAAQAWGTQGQLLSKGGSVSVTFEEPGLYPYSCYLHYGMAGVISVGDARSMAGGSAETLRVLRSPGYSFEFQEAEGETAVSAATDADAWGGMWLAAGGVLAGAVVVSGAWVLHSRR